MWCRVGNKQKNEGKYRKSLRNKIMFHSRKNSFWKDKRPKKKNDQIPKNSNKSMATRH
jgi:hypothetical protein